MVHNLTATTITDIIAGSYGTVTTNISPYNTGAYQIIPTGTIVMADSIVYQQQQSYGSMYGGTTVATKATSEKTTHLVVNLSAGPNGAFLLDSFENEKEAISFARRYVGQDKAAVVTIFKAVKRVAAKPAETEESDL